MSDSNQTESGAGVAEDKKVDLSRRGFLGLSLLAFLNAVFHRPGAEKNLERFADWIGGEKEAFRQTVAYRPGRKLKEVRRGISSPEYATVEDVMGKNMELLWFTQAGEQEIPPDWIEYHGFVVISKAEGLPDLARESQSGPVFYLDKKSEDSQEKEEKADGITMLEGLEAWIYRPSVFSGLYLAWNTKGKQALVFDMDHDPNVFSPEEIAVSVQGSSGRVYSHLMTKNGPNDEFAWQVIVPLEGFSPQLPEGVDGRNVAEGIKEGVRGIEKIELAYVTKDGKLTFSFGRKPMPGREHKA